MSEQPTEHDLYAEASRRLHDDAVLRYRAEVAARAVQLLRTNPKGPARGIDDDRMIAAIALVVADLALPGTP